MVTRPLVSLSAPNGVTEPAVQRFEFNFGVLERGDQVERAALVPEEQVLGVAACNLSAQGAALLDGEQWRMVDGRVPNPQLVEIGKQLVRSCGHVGRRVTMGGGRTTNVARLQRFYNMVTEFRTILPNLLPSEVPFGIRKAPGGGWRTRMRV